MVGAPTPHTALRFQTEVGEAGRVEFTVPLAPGTRVTIFIIEDPADTFDDLLQALESNLGFWDNPHDDKDWQEG
jgi:hypothetical protein